MLNLLIKYDDEIVFRVTQHCTGNIFRQTSKCSEAIYPETGISLPKISSGDKIAMIGIEDQIYN